MNVLSSATVTNIFASYSLPVAPRLLLPLLPPPLKKRAILLPIALIALLTKPGLAVCSAGVLAGGRALCTALEIVVAGESPALTSGRRIGGSVDGSIVPS